ncbi:FkbM family methyltransferase [Desulfosediminicola ganghwensis]|uniref:FkbM family methyltransferase n=1 Tax=Desulfosediminicola ganghwensis TaxID=2569540 RepID=UPI0010ACB9AB|nr:FkbM family methyltransferase [Desulfosediminicola ganghwensis]
MTPWERLQEAWCRVRGWYPARVAGRQLRCDPDHISFWSKVDNGSWEPQTFTVLDSILAPGGIHLDVGAWIGPTVLHAAHCSKKVFCFEPDKVAYMYLLANLKLNKLDNVIPFNMAVAEKSSISRMASPRGKRGDSMTSLLYPDGKAGMEVVVIAWQQWLELVGRPVFTSIKMDVEGGEFTLLPAMKSYLQQQKPALYLSLHPHLLPVDKRQQQMTAMVDLLSPLYELADSGSGERQPVGNLLTAERVDRGGSYLLLPVA